MFYCRSVTFATQTHFHDNLQWQPLLCFTGGAATPQARRELFQHLCAPGNAAAAPATVMVLQAYVLEVLPDDLWCTLHDSHRDWPASILLFNLQNSAGHSCFTSTFKRRMFMAVLLLMKRDTQPTHGQLTVAVRDA